MSWRFAWGIVLCLAIPMSARAESPYGERLTKLEGELAQCAGEFREHSQSIQSPDLDDRLQEGIVLQASGNHQRASAIFMDIVSHTEWRGRPGYQAAQLQLARSLYEDGYYRLSQRHLLDIMKTGSGLERTEGIVLLLQVAVRTGDWEEINTVLANDKSFQNSPAYAYIVGRAMFLQGQDDAARASLEKAAAGKDEWMVKANYLLGVLDTRTKDFDKALARFRAVAASTVAFKGAELARELAILAVARIHYETGNWSGALDAYQQIRETSVNFPAVLYEMGWTHIRMDDYANAKQKFELLLIAYPEDRHAFETRKLLADISRELGQYDEAATTYQKLVDEFEPVMTQMRDESSQLHERQARIRSQFASGEFGDVQIIPDRARGMVAVDHDVRRVDDMIGSLQDSSTNTQEADALIAEIRAALASDATVRNLPEFRKFNHSVQDIRIGALLLCYEIALENIEPSPELAQIAETVRGLPQNQRERDIYFAILTSDREAREARLHKLRLSAESMRQRTKILKQWLHDGHASNLTEEERKTIDAKIVLFETQLQAIAQTQAEIEKKLVAARGSAGAEEETGWTEELDRMENAMTVFRADAASWKYREEFARAMDILSRLRQLDADIQTATQARVADFRARLEREAAMLEIEKEKYVSVRSDVGDTASHVSIRYWHSVYEQIRNMVLNADLGLVDIAWLLKDARSKALAAAMEERKKEREVLEQDFKQFLTEAGAE